MKKILVATHNIKKRNEIKALLKGCKQLRVTDLDDLKVAPPIIIEDGRTFRQNAVKKAVTLSKFFDHLVIADDSGLEVEALGGKPGVRSARFARSSATDEENNKKLVKLMSGVPGKKRKARFICHIACASGGVLLDSFEGAIKGRITEAPKGRNGFGYDPLFIPRGHEKTFAEMGAAFKNRISHRAIALGKLKKSIRKYSQ